MKKLTLEQKAKRYDVAIEELRNAFYNDNNRMCEEYRQAVIKVIEPIFPELKESEDENIKKDIIDCIRYMKAHYCLPSRYTSKQYGTWIAWLEKAVTPTLQDWNDYKDKPRELWNAYGKGLANGIERGKEAVKNHPQDYGLVKQNEQKPITDFSNLKTWKYIVDAVLTEKEGIGQYLDSPFTEEVAKKLQKRFGNIKQTPCNKEDIGIDTILDKANIKLYKEGDVWCILYGENVDEGICGYGNTKEDAFMDFLSNLLEEKTIHNAKQVSTNIIWHDASNISIDTPDEHKEIICETEDLIGNKIHTIAYYSKADNRFFIEYRVISNVKRWVYLNDVLSYTTLDITKSMSLARQYRNYREECGVKDAIVLAEIENAYFTALTDNSVYMNPSNVEKDDTKI